MRKRTGPTRKERVARASRLLDGLLRSPKSKPGLIAAAASSGITKHFVLGWLTEQTRKGSVTQLKSGTQPQYQKTEFVVIEKPSQSVYPAWLEPRAIPAATSRHVHIDAKLVNQFAVPGDQQCSVS